MRLLEVSVLGEARDKGIHDVAAASKNSNNGNSDEFKADSLKITVHAIAIFMNHDSWTLNSRQ